jgi:hypothetical protein
MSGKFALMIGNTEYTDTGLAQLTAPGRDVEDFVRVIKDQDICAFDDVKVLLNQPEHIVRRGIDVFFDQKKPDDLLVLYFSGHGIRDEVGRLYLAVKNTIRSRLRSTAIKSEYIREAMDQSRSKRQVLILDCCNSGAFAQGTKAATGVSFGTATAFEVGYGSIILTASDSMQFAWEGNKVIGETQNSLFTHFLIEGLKGEADNDGDGQITVDELYDYAYVQVKLATPKQTPSKFSSKQQGEIVLRQSMRIEDIKHMPLTAELIDEIEDTRPYVREVAVQKLEKILKGRNIGMARSAREALEKIATDENTTRRVAQAATQALDSVSQVEQKTKEERRAILKAEAERLAREKAEQKARLVEERLLHAQAEREGAEREAAEKAEREAKEKVTVAPGKTTSLRPTPRRSILGWSIIGLSVLCVIGVGAWGISTKTGLDKYTSAPPTQTTSVAETSMVLTSAPTEIIPPTSSDVLTSEPPAITTVPTGTQEQESVAPTQTLINTGNIGKSFLGRSIDFTRIGNGPQIIVIAGALHGTEPNAANLVDNLSENFENTIETIQGDFTFYFLPRLNPDGLYDRSRYNANGVDLNRNWDTSDWRRDAEGPSGTVIGSGGNSPFSGVSSLLCKRKIN